MMRQRMSRILAALVIVALALPFTAPATVARPTDVPADLGGGVTVVTASDAGMDKVHPNLRSKAATAAADEEFHIVLRVKNGVDVTGYLREPLIRPFSDDGLTTVYGYIKAAWLPKLANVEAVDVILPVEGVHEPPRYRDPDAPDSASAAERTSEVGVAAWHDVLDNHNSKAAWDKGYTGEGVRVAVLDSGVDFGHPDLQGTQAIQPFGDYEGWPIAIDSWSLYLKAYDYYLGYSYVANGWSWYADTSTVVYTDTSDYQPIGATTPHTYVLPETSLSGTYHIGSHPDESLQAYWYDERVAVLVVDENTAGVYDTVYVDLDNDYDFTNEKACTKDDPISTRDLNDDGYADVSGGMIYWIADGTLSVPFGSWFWGLPADPAGELVAFFLNDETEAGGDHGTLCASAVVGQGVIDGDAPAYKPAGDGTPGTGLVVGGGRDVELVGVGNHYIYGDSDYDHYALMVYGLDGELNTGDEVQIASNSWGFSQTHNDGWTYIGRMISSRQRLYNPTMSVLFSTGNGGPGFGTLAPPEDSSFIGIAASTQMGSTGWDSATTMDQITYGDIAAWSNRGPTAQGNVGVQIAADGAYASGDLPLNIVGDGWYAWDTWGGTSRSAPIAAGNLALVYDAFMEANGRWPTYQEAKEIFMSGAKTTNNNVTLQGAGMVDADRSTDIAAGLHGTLVMPEEWTVGDYRGESWPGFANIVYPGQTYAQNFTIANHGDADVDVTVASDTLIRTGEMTFEWDSADLSQEDAYRFDYPGYLVKNLTSEIPAGTDLMIIRMAQSYDSFDPTGSYDYTQDNLWRLVAYDWTDVNENGMLWQDANANGAVNCPDGWGTAGCEVDQGEYVRFAYLHSASPTEMVTIQTPLERMHDGVWLGLQHNRTQAAVPTTHFKFRVEFYEHKPWDVLSIGGSVFEDVVTVPAGGSTDVVAVVDVPADMPVGFYEGALLVTDPGDGMYDAHTTTVPIVFDVAAPSADFVFGGPPASASPYDNGRIFGAMDLLWREEQGDWRFFFFDVPDNIGEGVNLLVSTRWDNTPTDIDTLILGPTEDEFTSDPEARFYDPDYYGPYTLEITGQSNDVQIDRSVWLFNTATGGPHEIVAAEARPGLNAILLHNVIFAGEDIDEVVTGQVGTIRAMPSPIEIVTVETNGTTPVTVDSSLNLADLAVDGFGFSEQMDLLEQPIQQDDPNDPCSASFTHDMTLEHAASLDVWTDNTGNASDIDLYLYYDANGDGVFACPGEQIASSGNPDDQESVSVSFPTDGDYRIGVMGWSVATGTDTFDLHISSVQGTNLYVPALPEGPFPAFDPIEFELGWDVPDLVPGYQAEGVMLLGPSVAPGAVSVPVIFSSPETTMAITPDSAEFRVTETQTVDLAVTAAEDIYAAEAHLTYDPRVVHVKSITQGDLLPEGSSSAIINWDDSLGSIDIAITLLNPATPVSGDGVLASIEFEGVGVGMTDLAFTNVLFSDMDGIEKPLWLYGGAFNVLTNLGTVSGTVAMQGRDDATGVMLNIAGVDFEVTDPTGAFMIEDVPMGVKTLTASFDGYLDAAIDVTVIPEDNVDVGAGTLRGGDANNDGVINAQDLAIVGSAFGTSPPSDPRADFNADDIINILDLVMAGANFGGTSPTPW